jgi:hypothetical protein
MWVQVDCSRESEQALGLRAGVDSPTRCRCPRTDPAATRTEPSLSHSHKRPRHRRGTGRERERGVALDGELGVTVGAPRSPACGMGFCIEPQGAPRKTAGAGDASSTSTAEASCSSSCSASDMVRSVVFGAPCMACGHVGAQAHGSASGRSRAKPPSHLQRVGPSGSAGVRRKFSQQRGPTLC